MRMRKKKHGAERIAACAEYLIEDTSLLAKLGSDPSAIFAVEKPIHMEIGCGKGGFVCELASRNKGRNYIALEMVSNVVISAMENAEKQGAENVRFLNIRAECLQCYIPEGSVENIYLNFSTPLPKLGYATQRLTHRNFLAIYKKLLKEGGRIIQKTDNRDFFDFSLEEYRAAGFSLENTTYNLHENGNPEWNIVTEYEKKWVEQGLPIHRVEAVK